MQNWSENELKGTKEWKDNRGLNSIILVGCFKPNTMVNLKNIYQMHLLQGGMKKQIKTYL